MKVRCPFCVERIDLDDPETEVYTEDEGDEEVYYITCPSCSNEFEKHVSHEV